MRFIDIFVDKFIKDCGVRFRKGNSPTGRLPYDEAGLLKLYLYCSYNRIQGSRRLYEETCRNVEAMFLMRSARPKYHTISDFRSDNADLVKSAFTSFRDILVRQKKIDYKDVIVDGTKMKAYANNNVKLCAEEVERRSTEMAAHIDQYLKEMDAVDVREGLSDDIVELEGEKRRLSEEVSDMRADIKAMEAKFASGSPVFKNYTESSRMKMRDKAILPCHNVQTAVDAKNGLVIDSAVTDDCNDMNQLQPMVDGVIASTSVKPGNVIADMGYSNIEQIHEMEGRPGNGVRCTVPFPEKAKRRSDMENGISFTPCDGGASLKCSRGMTLRFTGIKNRHGKDYREYRADPADCGQCPLRGLCTKSSRSRTVWIYVHQDWKDSYINKISKSFMAKCMRVRKKIEQVFGTVKLWMGMNPLLLTGRRKVQTQMDIYNTAFNMLRYINMVGVRKAITALKYTNLGRIAP